MRQLKDLGVGLLAAFLCASVVWAAGSTFTVNGTGDFVVSGARYQLTNTYTSTGSVAGLLEQFNWNGSASQSAGQYAGALRGTASNSSTSFVPSVLGGVIGNARNGPAATSGTYTLTQGAALVAGFPTGTASGGTDVWTNAVGLLVQNQAVTGSGTHTPTTIEGIRVENQTTAGAYGIHQLQTTASAGYNVLQGQTVIG